MRLPTRWGNISAGRVQQITVAPSMNLRAVVRDGQPWFIAKDVCSALELIDTGMALKGIHDSDKVQPVMRSNKGAARDFQRWVTLVVLPAKLQ